MEKKCVSQTEKKFSLVEMQNANNTKFNYKASNMKLKLLARNDFKLHTFVLVSS